MHYYIYDRPAHSTSSENPARFTWMPMQGHEAPYRIEVYRQGCTAYLFENIEYNFYTPDCIMEPGDYTYRVFSQNGELVGEKPFAIAPDAVHTPLAARENRYQTVGGHPRIWLNAQDLPRAKRAITRELKAEWDTFLENSVQPWLDAPVKAEPLPYPGNERVLSLWRRMYVDCQEALYAIRHCAVAWHLTGDRACLDTARRWLNAIAQWDVNGTTSRAYNDEAAFRILTALAWGYDWLYDELTEEERTAVHDALLARGRELFTYLREESGIHIKLLDSHAVRSLSMTLIPVALALCGEEPEAQDWLNYTLEYFFTLYTPWGGEDGGWAEGPSYWQTGVSFCTEAMCLVKKATGVDIFKRPFFRNTGNFVLNTGCQDTRFMGFCDMSDLGDFPNPKSGYTMRLLSAVTDNPNAPYYAWFFQQARQRRKSNEKEHSNYDGWWDFVFDELFFSLLYSDTVAPAVPEPGLQVTHFRDIGWVTLHKDMADAQKHIAFYFKASPYGSVSHSHGDQNAFVLHAFGEPLAIQSGYYVGFQTEMNRNWRRNTISKNAITVGGVGQYAYLQKMTKAKEINAAPDSVLIERRLAAKGKIEACEQSEGRVYLRGDATAAFAATVEHLLSNKRHVIFVDESFFVIVDEIALSKPDVIDYRLHALEPFAFGEREVSVQGEKAGMRVLFDQDVALSQTDVFEGVDPAEYEGKPTQYHLVATTREAKTEHTFVSVVYPYATGCEKQLSLEGNRITFDGKTYTLQRDGEAFAVR